MKELKSLQGSWEVTSAGFSGANRCYGITSKKLVREANIDGTVAPPPIAKVVLFADNREGVDQANVILCMTAAPDIYDALLTLVSEYGSKGASPAWDKAFNAIKKARGDI